MEVHDVDDLSGMIDRWHKAVMNNDKPRGKDAVEIFKDLGFTNIVVNENGTVDATRNRKRFIGLSFPHPLDCYNDEDNRGIVEVQFSYDALNDNDALPRSSR